MANRQELLCEFIADVDSYIKNRDMKSTAIYAATNKLITEFEKLSFVAQVALSGIAVRFLQQHINRLHNSAEYPDMPYLDRHLFLTSMMYCCHRLQNHKYCVMFTKDLCESKKFVDNVKKVEQELEPDSK